MQAPDPSLALAYVRIGASVIPLVPRDKRPWAALLPDGTWKHYQVQRSTQDDIVRWVRTAEEAPNWGVICGQVSGGLYCGDCDDQRYSDWILEHASDPLFRGACIVRSGSGKAHVWFRSTNPVYSGIWKPSVRGKKIGDIRGDGNGTAGGSYMVVPPSIHPDTGEPYTRVAGSFTALPMIDNGSAFLQEIATRILADHPGEAPPAPASNDKHFLLLQGDEQTRVVAHVRGLKLKKRIEDTILRPGNQASDSPHWARTTVSSHSEVDYAVVCELVRKGQIFEQVEEIFAATVVGDACYRNASRGNHGYAYLRYTFDKARAEVERERQATRIAAGANFRVTHVRRTVFDKDRSVYRLQVECVRADGSVLPYQVDLEDEDLTSLDRTKRAFIKQVRFVPTFANNQQGRHYAETFGQAVMDSVTEEVGVLESHTRYGALAAALRRFIHGLPEGEPADVGRAHGLGWRVGDECTLRALGMNAMLKGHDHNYKPEDARKVLDILDPSWEAHRHRWPDGRLEDAAKLRVPRA